MLLAYFAEDTGSNPSIPYWPHHPATLCTWGYPFSAAHDPSFQWKVGQSLDIAGALTTGVRLQVDIIIIILFSFQLPVCNARPIYIQ